MSESQYAAAVVSVRKRDGRTEPYLQAKVESCLRTVIIAAGEGTRGSAHELAEAVTTFLRASPRRQPLRTKQLAALLQRVLGETGHSVASTLLRRHGEHRDRRRRNVNVLAWKASVGRIVPRRWNKSVLVSRLQREDELEPSVARLIAGRVEEIVLSLNMRVVTGGLIRELAASEMLAWGLADEALVVHAVRA
ncbi:MAG: ATP cone domain-containing protein [Phycisphaerae bacterium]